MAKLIYRDTGLPVQCSCKNPNLRVKPVSSELGIGQTIVCDNEFCCTEWEPKQYVIELINPENQAWLEKLMAS